MTPTAAVLLSGSGIDLEPAGTADTWHIRPSERSDLATEGPSATVPG